MPKKSNTKHIKTLQAYKTPQKLNKEYRDFDNNKLNTKDIAKAWSEYGRTNVPGFRIYYYSEVIKFCDMVNYLEANKLMSSEELFYCMLGYLNGTMRWYGQNGHSEKHGV